MVPATRCEEASLLKLVWMSDPHFSGDGDVLGHDPRARLSLAVDHVNSHHGDAEFCVISGDMVNRASKTDYQTLRDHLDRLTVPVMPMVGNHDDRDLFRAMLPLPASCMSDFVQYSIPADDYLILCLDTLKPGVAAGQFCEGRVAWLRNELENAGGRSVILFMHHPPLPLGLPMQDADMMEDGARFLDLVSGYDCVTYLFIGHVHRPISGTVRGLPFSTMRSVLFQAPPPRPEWNWDSFEPAAEAPGLGIVTMQAGSVILQYEQFCPYEYGLRNDGLQTG